MMKTKKPRNINNILKKRTLKMKLNYYGHSNEILFGILYLMTQYPKKICITLPKRFKGEPSISLKWICKRKKYIIEYPRNKSEFINSIKSCKKQFVVVPLFIFFSCNNTTGHANCLIFDTHNKTIERFEPYGKIINKVLDMKEFQISKKFDKSFSNMIKQNKLPYKYKPVESFCPTINVQYKEENNINSGKTIALKDDLPGFCSLWIIWYINIRLKYNNLDASELLYKSMELLNKNKKSTRSFIRKYAQFLQTKMKQLHKKYKTNDLDTINEHLLQIIYNK